LSWQVQFYDTRAFHDGELDDDKDWITYELNLDLENEIGEISHGTVRFFWARFRTPSDQRS